MSSIDNFVALFNLSRNVSPKIKKTGMLTGCLQVFKKDPATDTRPVEKLMKDLVSELEGLSKTQKSTAQTLAKKIKNASDFLTFSCWQRAQIATLANEKSFVKNLFKQLATSISRVFSQKSINPQNIYHAVGSLRAMFYDGDRLKNKDEILVAIASIKDPFSLEISISFVKNFFPNMNLKEQQKILELVNEFFKEIYNHAPEKIMQPVVPVAPKPHTIPEKLTPRALFEDFSKREYGDQKLDGKDVKGYVQKGTDITKLKELLDIHNKRFWDSSGIGPYRGDKTPAFVEKADFPEGSEVYVRADIHSDLKTLLQEMQFLQAKGFLDQDFKCKKDFHMVFLGDYMDRGVNDIETLSFILSLQEMNPEQVHVLRGNHEDLAINGEKQWLLDLSIQDSICRCYTSMPVTFFAAGKTKDTETKKEYIHFSHGLCSFDTDPSIFLEQPGISRFSLDDLCQKKSLISSTTDKDELERVKKVSDHFTSANIILWSDVVDKGGGTVDEAGRPSFSTPAVKAWAKRTKTKKAVLKALFRGHSHALAEFSVKSKKDAKGKIFVTTLPVGAQGNLYGQSPQFKSPEQALLLTVSPKARNWTKQWLKQEGGVYSIDQKKRGLYESSSESSPAEMFFSGNFTPEQQEKCIREATPEDFFLIIQKVPLNRDIGENLKKIISKKALELFFQQKDVEKIKLLFLQIDSKLITREELGRVLAFYKAANGKGQEQAAQ